MRGRATVTPRLLCCWFCVHCVVLLSPKKCAVDITWLVFTQRRESKPHICAFPPP